MRDEVRGKKRKGVGCCVEHGKIDHLACEITYNSSCLCLALAGGAGSKHRLPTEQAAKHGSESEERLVAKRVGFVSCCRVMFFGRSCIARRLVFFLNFW